METTLRNRTFIFGFFWVLAVFLPGVGIIGCTRTAETPPPNLPQQTPSSPSSDAAAPEARPPEEAPDKIDPSAAASEDSEISEILQSQRLRKEEEKERKEAQEALEKENEARRLEELKKYVASLGEPLVDHPEDLKHYPDCPYPVWIDPKNRRVVLLGEVCQSESPLEMFACLRGTKEHEAVLSVPTEAAVVHTALLLMGAKPGHPVQYGPEGQYTPAAGTEIEITVHWKDAQGKVQTARAQDWIKNMQTGEPLASDWVFAGSGFWKDETTGKQYYKAEGGDFICVSNFSSAMLDLPVESSQSNADLVYQANPDRIPPRGTAVTVILTPQLKADGKASDEKAKSEAQKGEVGGEK
ncbi:MAG: hypothetical protein JXB10_17790 [Pirellulales bacterium]|nr:hypothetical protein [Pirellulales bacterium]